MNNNPFYLKKNCEENLIFNEMDNVIFKNSNLTKYVDSNNRLCSDKEINQCTFNFLFRKKRKSLISQKRKTIFL